MESPDKRLKEEFLPFDSLPRLFRQTFFRQVLSHIHTFNEWHHFSLVCRAFSHWCREEAEERKKEFSQSISDWLKNVGGLPLNPNGIFFEHHETDDMEIFIKKHEEMYPLMIKRSRVRYNFILPLDDTKCILPNGKLHGTWNAFHLEPNTFNCGKYVGNVDISSFFVKNVLVTLFPSRYVNFENLSRLLRVVGHFCPACKSVHYFIFNRDKWKFFKSCFEKTWRIDIGQKFRSENRFFRRMVIAKSILEYAQTQIK